MEPSEIRKRVVQTLDRAKHRAAAHREEAGLASEAFDRLLPRAAAVWRQVASILKAEGHGFAIHTPTGLLRLASDRSGDDFVEVSLDTARRPVAVVVHTRLARGRHVIDRETLVAEGAGVAALDEERLLAVLLQELEPFVER